MTHIILLIWWSWCNEKVTYRNFWKYVHVRNNIYPCYTNYDYSINQYSLEKLSTKHQRKHIHSEDNVMMVKFLLLQVVVYQAGIESISMDEHVVSSELLQRLVHPGMKKSICNNYLSLMKPWAGINEDIAEGEQIYSARFMGDKAYLVF